MLEPTRKKRAAQRKISPAGRPDRVICSGRSKPGKQDWCFLLVSCWWNKEPANYPHLTTLIIQRAHPGSVHACAAGRRCMCLIPNWPFSNCTFVAPQILPAWSFPAIPVLKSFCHTDVCRKYSPKHIYFRFTFYFNSSPHILRLNLFATFICCTKSFPIFTPHPEWHREPIKIPSPRPGVEIRYFNNVDWSNWNRLGKFCQPHPPINSQKIIPVLHLYITRIGYSFRGP